MTGQIVTQTEVGKHNAELGIASARILEGGSWKKQRVVVLIPSAKTLPAKVALSQWNLVFPPNQAVYRVLALGMEVGDAYSQAMDAVLQNPELSSWEYVLTLEADNAPPPDGLVKLIRRMEEHPELSAISGLYWTKGEAGVPQIWGDPTDPVLNYRPQVPKAGELVECCGLGMGFVLHRMSMFRDLAEKKLERPWWKTLSGDGGVSTQDLYFWGRARQLGHRCAVDCGVLVGHFDHDGKFGPAEMMW